MPSITFIGKHSKDRVLSIYLDKRVYVDEGEGIDPISGIVRLDPEYGKNFPYDHGVFCTLACYFVYECYDFDLEIIDHTLYDRSVQLFPRSEALAQPKNTKLVLPDDHYFPFEFRLPVGLPPSMTLNPGFVYLGRPLGISYEVYAHVGPLNVAAGGISNQKSRAALRIRKSSYFPLLRDIKPTETGDKIFLGGSKPLILTATLDREIYYPGQPIIVTVDIKNQSNHDVHKIRISAKQVVTARIHSGDKEKYKCQVAVLESTRGCPIRKHTDFSQTYTLTPTIMTQETYHVAQLGRLNMSEDPQLAPSTRADESPKDRKGLQVAYYVNVHCEVSLAKDLIVKIPFIISSSEKKADITPAPKTSAPAPVILPPETELLVGKLVSLGYSRSLATKALKDHNGNFEHAFDWLKAHKSEAELEPEPSVHNEGMLISFEDADQGHDDPVPGQYDPFSDMAIRPGKAGGAKVTLVEDINRAGEAIAAARMELVTVQAAAAQGMLAPLPVQENEFSHLMDAISSAGSKLQEFVNDLSNPNDANTSYSSAYATANHIKVLLNIVKSVASHAHNTEMQQNLLNLMYDLLERVFLLLGTSRGMISNPPNAETRRKVMALTVLISQGFNALRAALPGLKDIDIAVSTIHSAVSELSSNLPPGVDGEALQQSLDNLNSFASQLSQAFQKLGAVSTGPTDELAIVAQQYRTLLPIILSNGKVILGGMMNETAKFAFLKLLQDAASSNVQLLLVSKEVNVDPKNSVLKNKLEARARDVVESMKKLLMASNSLQNQLKLHKPASHTAAAPPASQPEVQPQVQPQPQPQATSPTSTQRPVQKPVNPAVQQFKAPPMKRRDSFDEFIFHRVGSKPSSPVVEDENDPTLGQLTHICKEVDVAQKNVLSARAKPRKLSLGTSPTEKPSSGSAILDSTLVIVQNAYHLMVICQERYKEVSIIGSSFSGGMPQQDKDRLVSAAKAFSAAITELANRSNGVSSDGDDVTRLVVASSTASGAAATLLDACRSLSTVNTSTQQQIESSAKETIQRLTIFVSTVMNFPTPDKAVNQAEKAMRVLQLEQTLERDRSNELLASPRKASRRTGSDSD